MYFAGVADGVGGWRAWGIDPGEFSHSLMTVSERVVRSGRFKASEPAAIIARAYYELLENKTHILGELALSPQYKTIQTSKSIVCYF